MFKIHLFSAKNVWKSRTFLDFELESGIMSNKNLEHFELKRRNCSNSPELWYKKDYVYRRGFNNRWSLCGISPNFNFPICKTISKLVSLFFRLLFWVISRLFLIFRPVPCNPLDEYTFFAVVFFSPAYLGMATSAISFLIYVWTGFAILNALKKSKNLIQGYFYHIATKSKRARFWHWKWKVSENKWNLHLWSFVISKVWVEGSINVDFIL